MSISDPGGGGVVSGGVIEGGGPPSSVTVSSVPPSNLSSIVWNDKTILLPNPSRSGSDEYFGVYPLVPRKTNVTLTGRTETLIQPRSNVGIKMRWNVINQEVLDKFGIGTTTARMRTEIVNCWQWMQSGGDVSIALYSDRTVYTTLGGSPPVGANAGDTILTLMDISGIVIGQRYALLGGPRYTEVEVIAIDATLKQVTVHSNLDFAFAPLSLFRDQFFWHAIILDDAAPSPIEDNPYALTEAFAFELNFNERLVGT